MYYDAAKKGSMENNGKTSSRFAAYRLKISKISLSLDSQYFGNLLFIKYVLSTGDCELIPDAIELVTYGSYR